MNEHELLDLWKNSNYVNPDGIEAAYKIIEMLLARIEQLEAKVN